MNNLPPKLREEYGNLMADAELCRQEIATTSAEIVRCENRRVLLRRAIRLKGMGIMLNQHQKRTLSDTHTPTTYLNKAQLLRRRLQELKIEHGIILDKIGLFRAEHSNNNYMPYSLRLRSVIAKHIVIEGFGINNLESNTALFIENECWRIYASPFWELEDPLLDRENTLQIDVYNKKTQEYFTSTMQVRWCYSLERDTEQWRLIILSVIATLKLKEVDPFDKN